MPFLGLLPEAIPSPPQAVWYLGSLPFRAYSLAILVGIFAAVWLGKRRYEERGGNPELIFDIALWAVPLGIIGGRLYHVISSPAAYFGAHGDPWRALRIWEGGLGIWGAVALGALGVWFGARKFQLRFGPLADALAPGVLLAQAIGRLGNWFNQELFGGPTTLPWGLKVDWDHLPAGYPVGTLFHPTFLYELLWNLAGVAVLLYLDHRLKLRSGQVFWLYVAVYTLGRVWIEMLRIDTANHILGLRLNVWTSILLFVVAVIGIWWTNRYGKPSFLSAAERDIHDGSKVDEDDATSDKDEVSAEVTDEHERAKRPATDKD